MFLLEEMRGGSKPEFLIYEMHLEGVLSMIIKRKYFMYR
jgi:hypothetical protein